MLLIRFLNFLSGYRLVSCPPAFVTELLNLLRREEIDVWETRRQKDGRLTFYLLEKEYKRLQSLLDGREGVITEARKGLPYFLYRYRKRIGIPIGLVLMLVLTKLSTLYIWDVTVSGNENLSDAEVIASLEELGCSVGSYIPGVDFYNICHEFILENESVSWISVNIVGTTAEVKIIERDAKGQTEDEGNGTPSNLVARFDGEIVRTETASGELYVVAGETVRKGQLLVGGVLEIGQGEDTGRFTLVRSRGKIYARTERLFEVSVPLDYVKKVPKGRVVVKKTLKFFGKSMKLQENSSILPEECDIIVENKRIVLFEGDDFSGGVPLPVSLVTEYYEAYEEIEVTLKEAEALAIAEIEMTSLTSSELQDAEILNRESEWSLRQTENGTQLVLTWKIVCIEDIAEEVPLGVEG